MLGCLALLSIAKSSNCQMIILHRHVGNYVTVATFLSLVAIFAFLFGRFGPMTKGNICTWKLGTLAQSVSLSEGSALLSVHSTPGHMIDARDFICGTYMDIHPPYMPIKYMTFMCNLVGIFVSGTYLVIACKVDVAFSCV